MLDLNFRPSQVRILKRAFLLILNNSIHFNSLSTPDTGSSLIIFLVEPLVCPEVNLFTVSKGQVTDCPQEKPVQKMLSARRSVVN